MAKSSNSIKPNLSQHMPMVTNYFITSTTLEAHQNYHGYVVEFNVKKCASYGDLCYN